MFLLEEGVQRIEGKDANKLSFSLYGDEVSNTLTNIYFIRYD